MKNFFKVIFKFVLILGLIIVWAVISSIRIKEINSQEFAKELVKQQITIENSESENTMVILNENNATKTNHKLNDWRLVLVNYENNLPEDFLLELSKIDSQREFDSRAIGELMQMLKDAKKDKITNLWVQSAYRSTERQEELFNNKVQEFMALGLSLEEAESKTSEMINRANTSEHNIGLAVDFNYVDYDFDKTKAFEWLQENAENYGFVLRYKKEKEDITKVNYEPWHWRYVGVEHAKKMNELGMCLEEYVELLENT